MRLIILRDTRSALWSLYDYPCVMIIWPILKKMFFVGLPHLATYFFLIFSMIEPELGAGIYPGMALTLTFSIYYFG
jgi:hypothetical protein